MVARVPLCSAFGAAEQPPTGCKRAENMLVSSPGKQLRSALNSGPGMSRDGFGHCDIHPRRRHGHDCHLKFDAHVPAGTSSSVSRVIGAALITHDSARPKPTV